MQQSSDEFGRDPPSMNQVSKSPLGGSRTTARAFSVSDRLNTSGLERGDVLATTPLTFRVNDNGVAVLFRYGVVVLIGLNALEEDEFIVGLQSRMTGPFERRDEEIAVIELSSDKDEQIAPGGPIGLQESLAGTADRGRGGIGQERGARPARARGGCGIRHHRAAGARVGAERADQRRPRFNSQEHRQRVVGASLG